MNCAAARGSFHSDFTVRSVGSAGQLKRCSVVCEGCEHLGHLSSMFASTTDRYELSIEEYPDLS